jgi:hypothetical protein
MTLFIILLSSPQPTGLGNYGASLTAFRRAIHGSQEIGCLTRAGHVALTVFQEMGERLAVRDKKGIISGRSLGEEIQLLEHEFNQTLS